MNSRIFRFAAAAMAVTLTLAGCSGGSSEADDNEPLQFLLSGDANQGGGYQAMATKYEAETGVKIKIVDIPYSDMLTRLRSGAQADDLPALARTSGVDPLWIDNVVDLADTAEKNKVIPSLVVRNDKNEVPALPSDLTAVGLFINKTLFDKAGVKYPGVGDTPWTWDEFVAALTKVKEGSGAKYGMVMDGSTHRLRSFMYQFGSKGTQKQADGSYALDAGGTTALEYFKKLNDDDIMPKSVWTSGDDASALFKTGQVAAYYSGVWQVTDFSKNITDFEWTTALMPAQPTRATNLGTNWMVVFKGSGVEDKAKAFVDWLYQPENYTELSQISGFLPAEQGLDIKYTANADAFAMFNAEIAASDPISGFQSTSGITDTIAGRMLETEALKEDTVKYLAGEQDLATTVKAINDQATEFYKK
ncbi:ABC transporter substrate-binding protein [Actinoplanes couchii]|uniref:Sugar ABC transporter substrate-binding protein n=1 Tax=Actinoplanes couchii TaxID=403638 RepID=A0ABQ3X8G5_9ACTN|nr:extracellular solute-binding protein [Actinoplanes couchii]MDR6320181.1 alpha-1,4-digalacturonate transport system substrate-binding protein [Actinoplanes couchii]GID54805.1 sugar ABC transporter substrate-binding protein [Actinoplanes couchii]